MFDCKLMIPGRAPWFFRYKLQDLAQQNKCVDKGKKYVVIGFDEKHRSRFLGEQILAFKGVGMPLLRGSGRTKLGWLLQLYQRR